VTIVAKCPLKLFCPQRHYQAVLWKHELCSTTIPSEVAAGNSTLIYMYNEVAKNHLRKTHSTKILGVDGVT
jgi:hypothetical protein